MPVPGKSSAECSLRNGSNKCSANCLFTNLAGTFPKYSTDTQQYAVFFEDRFELDDRWSIIGSARDDNNEYQRTNLLNDSRFGGKFSDTTWRVGIVFQPIETLSLYAQYATSKTGAPARACAT